MSKPAWPVTDLSPDAAWSSRADGCFDWRMWAEEAFVYVHATGATHALNPSASAVLATLLEHQGQRKTCEQWLEALSEGEDLDDNEPIDDDLRVLLGVLTELEGIGIAQRHVL